MNDERVIRLLEEMGDLQRHHAERYGDALRNQEESLRLQQAGLRRVRLVLGFADHRLDSGRWDAGAAGASDRRASGLSAEERA